jgi:hypothetical protein
MAIGHAFRLACGSTGMTNDAPILWPNGNVWILKARRRETGFIIIISNKHSLQFRKVGDD